MRTTKAWLRWLAILLATVPAFASAGQPATTALTGLPNSAVPGESIGATALIDGVAGPASGSIDFSLRNLSCNGSKGRLCGS